MNWTMNSKAFQVLGTVSLTLLLNACATDGQQTRTEGALTGAAVGATAGAIAGGKEATIAGAAAGGILGAIWGDSVAKKKEEYAKREDALRISAERATQLAQETRQQNEITTVQLTELERNIKRLRVEKLSAVARKNLTQSNEAKLASLLKSVDAQLVEVRAEIARQQTLLDSEERLAREQRDDSLQPRMRLVSAGVRELQTNEQALDRARAQLQLLDQKRAY